MGTRDLHHFGVLVELHANICFVSVSILLLQQLTATLMCRSWLFTLVFTCALWWIATVRQIAVLPGPHQDGRHILWMTTQLTDTSQSINKYNRPFKNSPARQVWIYSIFCQHQHIYNILKSGAESNVVLWHSRSPCPPLTLQRVAVSNSELSWLIGVLQL